MIKTLISAVIIFCAMQVTGSTYEHYNSWMQDPDGIQTRDVKSDLKLNKDKTFDFSVSVKHPSGGQMNFKYAGIWFLKVDTLFLKPFNPLEVCDRTIAYLVKGNTIKSINTCQQKPSIRASYFTDMVGFGKMLNVAEVL